MKIKLKVPTRSTTLPTWSSNQLSAYLVEYPSHSHRPEHVKAYVETFGKQPPDSADAWDVRTAVFYEQSLRRKREEKQSMPDTFIKRHAVALAFGTQNPKSQRTGSKEKADVAVKSAHSIALIFHSCGHKVTQAVTYEEIKFLERTPCMTCAPRAFVQDTEQMEAQVANHKKEEAKVMAQKANGKKSGPVGKGLVGKTSKLSKRAFYIQTLKENEKAKKSDADLQKIFDKEFPGTTSYPVAGIRSALNRGSFGDHGFQSKAYGEPAKKPATAPTKKTSSKKPAAEPVPSAVSVPTKKVRLRAPAASA